MELVKYKSFQKRIMIYDRKFNLTYTIFKEKQKKKEGNLKDRMRIISSYYWKII